MNLHQKAEACRAAVRESCDERNFEAERQAIDEFEQGEVAKYFRENAAYVTGLVVSRLKDMKVGKPTFPFRSFDAETLVRLLSVDTTVYYEAYGFDEDLGDAETVKADATDDLIQDGWSSAADTPTTEKQNKLRDALLEYVRCAAVLAKRIGSASLLDWAGIIDILENKRVNYSARVRQEDALRLVELQKSAADRLRLDKIIAALPNPKKSVRKAR